MRLSWERRSGFHSETVSQNPSPRGPFHPLHSAVDGDGTESTQSVRGINRPLRQNLRQRRCQRFPESSQSLLVCYGCPSGIRTPICCSRGSCPTIERRGNKQKSNLVAIGRDRCGEPRSQNQLFHHKGKPGCGQTEDCRHSAHPPLPGSPFAVFAAMQSHSWAGRSAVSNLVASPPG